MWELIRKIDKAEKEAERAVSEALSHMRSITSEMECARLAGYGIKAVPYRADSVYPGILAFLRTCIQS